MKNTKKQKTLERIAELRTHMEKETGRDQFFMGTEQLSALPTKALEQMRHLGACFLEVFRDGQHKPGTITIPKDTLRALLDVGIGSQQAYVASGNGIEGMDTDLIVDELMTAIQAQVGFDRE